MKIRILNGVNLGLLGTREVNVYGHLDFETYFNQLKAQYADVELSYAQTDDLTELVSLIHGATDCDAIILNPGAYTHTSVVLADAVKAISVPVAEVHISNLFAREQFRRNSCLASCCIGSVSGFGLRGYEMALHFFYEKLNSAK